MTLSWTAKTKVLFSLGLISAGVFGTSLFAIAKHSSDSAMVTNYGKLPTFYLWVILGSLGVGTLFGWLADQLVLWGTRERNRETLKGKFAAFVVLGGVLLVFAYLVVGMIVIDSYFSGFINEFQLNLYVNSIEGSEIRSSFLGSGMLGLALPYAILMIHHGMDGSYGEDIARTFRGE